MNKAILTLFSNWHIRLGKAGKVLRKLNESAEDKFMALGERVQQFYFKAKEISNMSGSVANQVASGEILSIIDGLRKLLDDMDASLKQSEEMAKQGEGSLLQIIAESDQVLKSLNGFEKIVRTLNILGVSTRIENSSVDDDEADFNILSEKVMKLADLIQEKSALIVAHSKTLKRLIQTTLANMIDLKQKHYVNTGLILEKTHTNLNALSSMQSASARTIKEVSKASDEINKKINDVVTSMQFRDITRQQIEHVVEALDDLSLELGAELAQKISGSKQNDLIFRTIDICDLQIAQLQQTEHSLLSEMNQIFANLRGISVRTKDCATEVIKVGGGSDDGEESFLADIVADISEISESLSRNAKTDEAMVSSIRSVADTVTEMFNFLRDIESIGSEIEMIALNAVVKALRIGKNGAALAVLAESIQQLSTQTKNQIHSISKALNKMSSSANQINENTKNLSTTDHSKLKGTLNELGDLLTTLSNRNKDVISSFHNLSDMTKPMAADIENVIEQFKIHNILASLLQRVGQAFGEIKKEAELLVPNRSLSERESSLAKLANRYTMASERTVHQFRLESKGESLPANELQMHRVVESSISDGADLDDNVEIF